MSNPFKTKQFKQLFNEWNEILEQTGFKDAEDFTLPEPALKSWHNFKFKRLTGEDLDAANRYHDLAAHVLVTFDFESPTHRTIWHFHIQGKSIRQIVALIDLKGFGRDSVHKIIEKIQKTNGLKRS